MSKSKEIAAAKEIMSKFNELTYACTYKSLDKATDELKSNEDYRVEKFIDTKVSLSKEMIKDEYIIRGAAKFKKQFEQYIQYWISYYSNYTGGGEISFKLFVKRDGSLIVQITQDISGILKKAEKNSEKKTAFFDPQLVLNYVRDDLMKTGGAYAQFESIKMGERFYFFRVRGWGNWVAPQDEVDDGDYNWKQLDDKSAKIIQQIQKKYDNKYGKGNILISQEEKNSLIVQARHRAQW